jgi:hypothetical protein
MNDAESVDFVSAGHASAAYGLHVILSRFRYNDAQV